MAEAFVREYPAGAREGLLLMGRPGVGKTHLGIAALRGLVQRGHDGLFYDYGELLKEIQASYNPVSQASEMDVLEPVVKVEVLLLDDLGASKPSAWALETVGYILNARYNANLPTLLTTNYLDREEPAPQQMVTGQRFTVAPESLSSRIGERMRSRLFEMCRTIEMKSADYRRDIRRAGPLRA